MNKDFFRLYANCIPVKGATRSLICDLQKEQMHFIPNDLFHILTELSKNSIKGIALIYGQDNKDTIQEYFDFLLQKEYIFLCEEKDLELFPSLNLQWEHPSLITNAIIDVGKEIDHDFENIFSQLESLGCKDVQIRFYKKVAIKYLIDLLKLLDESSIKSVELYLPYDANVQEDEIADLLKNYLRISTIVLHSCKLEKRLDIPSRAPILFVKDILCDATSCGVIAKKYFTINISLFTESQKHNSCLNRKIAIDSNGVIKNCPSMSTGFGNIKEKKLKDVVDSSFFRELWDVSKDDIETCKDCEFRYVCTDCRAYTLNNNSFSKPTKCNYNPYIGEWET